MVTTYDSDPFVDGSTVGRGLPERALMHAVLEDAIRCLHGGGSPMRERLSLASEARSWIESGDGRWPYSFENICSALDIDPGRVRSRLARVTPVFAAREPELATRAKHASVAES